MGDVFLSEMDGFVPNHFGSTRPIYEASRCNGSRGVVLPYCLVFESLKETHLLHLDHLVRMALKVIVFVPPSPQH